MKKYKTFKVILIIVFSGVLMATQKYEYFLQMSVKPENKSEFIDFVKDESPSEDAFVAVQRLAEESLMKEDYQGAAKIFDEYKKYFPNMNDRFNKIIKVLNTPSEDIHETNLGEGINTPENEYSPIPTIDEAQMFFTGQYRSDSSYQEDIYYTIKRGNIWQKAVMLGPVINTNRSEAPQFISYDGKKLIIFADYPSGFGRGDLYYTMKTNQGWRKLQMFPKPINSFWFDCDAKIINNGNAIIFTSDRPGGIGGTHKMNELFHGSNYGNTDIYICEKIGDKWSKPINLGPTINTPYSERKPFLHHDNKTLYFSSDGHYSLGRLDLYVSRRLREDSWTEWSEPENLGKEINGPGNDWGAIVSIDGRLAYYAGDFNKDNKGGTDIYTILLPDRFRPDPIVEVKGIVKDDEGQPVSSEVYFENLETGNMITKVNTNPETGEYFAVLPSGINYGATPKADGFYPESENIDTRNVKKTEEIEKQNNMISIERLMNRNIILNNLFFDFDRFTLKKESFPELNKVFGYMRELGDVKAVISGYTDSIGTNEYNFILSQKRVNSVLNYLVDKGIDKNRFFGKYFGEKNPIASNSNSKGRKKNRRVEIYFYKKH